MHPGLILLDEDDCLTCQGKQRSRGYRPVDETQVILPDSGLEAIAEKLFPKLQGIKTQSIHELM
jgi:hypothetical protein